MTEIDPKADFFLFFVFRDHVYHGHVLMLLLFVMVDLRPSPHPLDPRQYDLP